MKLLARLRIDEHGHLSLPQEALSALGLTAGDSLDLFLDGKGFVLWMQKSAPMCINCQSRKDLYRLPGGKYICRRCLSLAEWDG